MTAEYWNGNHVGVSWPEQKYNISGKERVEPRRALYSILYARCRYSSSSGHCTHSDLYFSQVMCLPYFFMPTSEI